MAVETRLVTANELSSLPDDGRRIELIREQLVETPYRSWRHGELVASITVRFVRLVREANNGTVLMSHGVVVSRDPDSVVISDVSFSAPARKSFDKLSKGYGEDVPAMLVDVVDLWDAAEDWFDRLGMCREAGIAATVPMWPERQRVTMFELNGAFTELRVGDELDLTHLVGGLRLSVADLFG